MIFTAPEATAARKAFYQRIDGENLAPLWEVLGELVPPTPRTPCVPASWRYSAVRKHLLESGTLITAKEAIRRVLARSRFASLASMPPYFLRQV